MTAATIESHVGELPRCARLRAGEGAARTSRRMPARRCADCRARLKGFDDEQRRFEQEISFDRFAAGVARASRVAASPPPARSARLTRTLRFMVPTLSLAAGVVLFLGVTARREGGSAPYVGIRGGADITVRVAAGRRPAAHGLPERGRGGARAGRSACASRHHAGHAPLPALALH